MPQISTVKVGGRLPPPLLRRLWSHAECVRVGRSEDDGRQKTEAEREPGAQGLLPQNVVSQARPTSVLGDRHWPLKSLMV